jgi:putative inorganic carbon (HCO3(-)) transporter
VIPRAAQLKTRAARDQAEPGGFLYGWLLFAIFLEYARPTLQIPFLAAIPFLYSIVPLLLLVFTCFASSLRPWPQIFGDKFTKWVMIFLGLVLLSYLVSGFAQQSLNVVERVLGYVFLFFMIARLATSERRLVGVVIALALAHLWVIFTNLQILANPSTRQYFVAAPFLGDGNDFGLSLCIMFAWLIGVGLLARGKFLKVFAFAAAGAMVLTIVASQSRGATLGIAAVMGVLWWRSSKKALGLVAVAIMGVAVIIYAPPEYFSRLSTLSDATADTSAQGRIDAWMASIGMGLKNPLGIGTGNFGARWGRTAHSTYFLALGELGIGGFVCVIMLVFGSIRANWKLHRQLSALPEAQTSEDARRSLRLLDMMNAGVIGFAVAGTFLSATYYPHIYVFSAMLLAARILATQRFPSLPPAVPVKKPRRAGGAHAA